MRNTILSYLLLPLFASLSFSLNAAPATPPNLSAPTEQIEDAQVKTMVGLLDLNQADATTLQRELNGIGKAKAEAIVAYRESNGPFTSLDELLEVKGIGKALLERNRGKLLVE